MVGSKLTKRTDRKINKAKQKEHLKTLVENSSVSKVRSAGRVLKYGAASFRRNVWLSIAATLVMTITLIILIITIGASLILTATAESMRQKIDITVYFAPGTSGEVLEQAAEAMRAEQNVKSIDISDTNAEYQALLDQYAGEESIMAVFGIEGMSDQTLSKLPAAMRIKVYDPDNFSGVKYIVDNNPIFQENLDSSYEPTYETNQAEIATITSWANVAR